MTPEMLGPLIPMVTTFIVFAVPVSIVFITKYFKLKNRELDIEAELQKKWGEDNRRQLEARVASLENAVNAVLQIVAPRAPQPTSHDQLAQLSQVAEAPPQGGGQFLAPPGTRERG